MGQAPAALGLHAEESGIRKGHWEVKHSGLWLNVTLSSSVRSAAHT